MKKIMFNDRYGLTQAVVDLIKTNTRRAEKSLDVLPLDYNPLLTEFQFEYKDGIIIGQRFFKGSHVETYHLKPRYKIGEVVAVAQRYKDINLTFIPHQDAPDFKKITQHARLWGNAKAMAGWTNKMFVRADLMPHRIRITDIKVERLQDITEDDVYKEGFSKESVNNGWGNAAWHWEAMLIYYDGLGRTREIRSRKPKEAFSFLIDSISGKGTWERNPWVFAYEFNWMASEKIFEKIEKNELDRGKRQNPKEGVPGI